MSNNIKPVHLNIPQAMHYLVGATKSYNVWARGTGKTTGVLAPWYLNNIIKMPRGMHGIIGATYQQLLVRTLPPVIQMWERMGYKYGVHFVFGREPDDNWKKMWGWEGPYTKPLKSEHAIYWYNGSVMVLISQDRVGSSNGLSLVSLGGDEAKLLNKERLDDEVIPALRGNRREFGHLTNYRSECYTTDMPTIAKAKWILDMAEQMDEHQIDLIIQTQLKVNLKRKALLHAKADEKPTILKYIRKLEKQLYELRRPRKVGNEYKYSVYYSEASALDNMDVLGPEYLSDMKRILSDIKYRTSILNEKIISIENGFYPNLDPTYHGTDWFNYSYLDGLAGDFHNKSLINQDSRHDQGYIGSRPLDIALDYGDSINCMVVAQEVKDEYRFLSSFYVLKPDLVDAVVDKFCKYYSHYPNKTVNYFHDHTAIPGSGVTDFNYYQRVRDTLVKNGWRVNDVYIGQAPPHETKYEILNLIFRESDPRMPKFRYSRTNCASWEVSALNSPAKTDTRGAIKKDKSAERDKAQPQEEAPHISDAGDTLLYGRFHTRLDDNTEFLPML